MRKSQMKKLVSIMFILVLVFAMIPGAIFACDTCKSKAHISKCKTSDQEPVDGNVCACTDCDGLGSANCDCGCLVNDDESCSCETECEGDCDCGCQSDDEGTGGGDEGNGGSTQTDDTAAPKTPASGF